MVDRLPEPKPVVRHNTVAKEANKFDNLMLSFTRKVTESFKLELIEGHHSDWREIDPDGKSILEYRKKLRDAVRENVFERKDQELKIAALAAIICYKRMEMEEQKRIIDTWI